ncbi:MAG: MFS transporter [Chloroflexi bacterium]|nr:MFS transporter [Chloroflexota bacterium]
MFAAQSAFSAAGIASFSVLSISAAILAGDPAYAGIPGAAMLFGRALAAYPIGWLMDAAGRRPALALGYLTGVAGAVVGALAIMAESYPGLVAGAAIFGMSRTASDQSRYVAAEVHSPQRRGRIIGRIVFAGTVGSITGPLIVKASTSLAEGAGIDEFAGPWLAAAVLVGAAVALVLAFVRPDPRDMTIASPLAPIAAGGGLDADARPLREIFRAVNVRVAVLAMLIGQLVMVMVMTIAPVHLHDHGHVPTTISIAIAVHTVGMFGLAALTGRLVDRYGQLPVIALGAAQLIAASLLTPFSADLGVMLLAMFLVGYGWNMCFVAGSALLIVGLSPRERGRTQGAGDALAAVAAATGSLATGPVFSAGGMNWVGVAALAGSLVLVTVLARRGLARQRAVGA